MIMLSRVTYGGSSLTREMSARTSGALTLMKRGEEARRASWKCTSSTEERGLLELPASACDCTCSQMRCTVCPAACLSPDHLISAVTAAGAPTLCPGLGGMISATQFACMRSMR